MSVFTFIVYGIDKYKAKNDGISKIQLDYINDAITELPENLKEPFMFYFEGYSYEEIAQKFEIPLGTVKSRIHHARKKLKKSLKLLFVSCSNKGFLGINVWSIIVVSWDFLFPRPISCRRLV